MDKKIIILLSGGLDSATILAIAIHEWKIPQENIYCLSFHYEQKHIVELEFAKKIINFYNIKNHIILKLDFGQFIKSALTDEKLAVPKFSNDNKKIPITYVPGRNTIFIACALSYAESLNASEVIVGANAIDYSGYPDCRPEYIEKFNELSCLANKVGIEGNPIKILAPLINMTKADIIKKGISLGIDYDLTISCYNPKNSKPCEECDACHLRSKGFFEAGYKLS